MTDRITPERMTQSLGHSIERDPNPNAYWRGAVPSGEPGHPGCRILVDVADPTGANGSRTFIATVREVDPPEGHDLQTILALARLIGETRMSGHEPMTIAVARRLLNAGVV